MMCCTSIRMARGITEECFKWSSQRSVFGKKLIGEPVIRQKLARMISLCEASQAWLEQVTEQMCFMDYKQQSKKLAGRIALLKTFATRCETEIADQAVQIFGGRGLTKGGMGDRIENHVSAGKLFIWTLADDSRCVPSNSIQFWADPRKYWQIWVFDRR